VSAVDFLPGNAQPMHNQPVALDPGLPPRELAGTRGAIALAAPMETSSAGNSALAPRETFAALDSDLASPGTGATTWVHAGAQHAEAGFHDPGLGWVSVRANVGEDGVHAALVPASTGASDTLAGHLSGLNAYLGEHNTQVAAVTLAPPDTQSHDNGMGQSGNHNPQHGSGQGTGQDPASNPGPSPSPKSGSGSSGNGSATQGTSQSTPHASRAESPATISQSGIHISVMA
jgi:hypothetical protein